ncbi:331_t:CDS:2, partial [Scutellospora calospora]
LTDRKHCRFDVKYDKTQIVGMYICITANGPIENLYKKLRESNSSIDINALYRRIRFIIKFEGEPIDPRIGYGDVLRIYEKGNKQDVNNRIFDIEFNRGTTLEEVKKVTLDLGIEDIDEITDRVITQIPKSDPGKRILVASSKDKNSKQNNTLETSKNYNSESSLSSNDSIETKRKKKGKQVIKKNNNIEQVQISFDNNIEVDLEQAQIRSNYNELSNKKRKLEDFLDFNELLEDNNLDNGQGSSKEIKRIRSDKGLNRLLKK